MILRDLDPAPDGDPQIALLLASLDDATQKHRRELGIVGVDAVRWPAYPDGPSIGMLLLHLADCEAYWIQQIGAGLALPGGHSAKFLSEQVDQYKPRWPSCPRRPLRYFYELQDEVRARTRALVQDFKPDQARPRTRTRLCTHRWIVSHIAQHESYHYGQAVLIKMMRQRLRASAG